MQANFQVCGGVRNAKKSQQSLVSFGIRFASGSPLHTMWTPLAVAALSAPSNLSFIHAGDSGGFLDEAGRVRIFHGCNRVKKSAPWYFKDMLASDAEFDLLEALGFNVVRLGFMWSGFNPAPGVFNSTYLQAIQTIVKRLAARGIYTLLDMHEDVLSSKFCTYDGAPLWVVNKASPPKHAFPWPLKGNCSGRFWMANTLTEAAAAAYQDLYDNTRGMLDDMAAFWARGAQAFAATPSVLGYELINEPFAGNFYADPALLLPGVAGGKNLQRMYDTVATAIYSHDTRHLLFYEPVTWGMIFDGKTAGSGFTHVPGGAAHANTSVFTFHYYCKSFVPHYETEPTLTKAVCDDAVKPLVFEAAKKETRRLGGAAFMSEGLSCDFEQKDARAECEAVMAALDKQLMSYTDYADSQGDTFAPSQAQQEGWARSYARAVAGTPLNMSFDAASKAFELCYTIDASIAAPTEVFASRTYSYPQGRAVRTTANLRAETDPARPDVVLVRPAAARRLVEGGEGKAKAKGAGEGGGVGCVWIQKE